MYNNDDNNDSNILYEEEFEIDFTEYIDDRQDEKTEFANSGSIRSFFHPRFPDLLAN